MKGLTSTFGTANLANHIVVSFENTTQCWYASSCSLVSDGDKLPKDARKEKSPGSTKHFGKDWYYSHEITLKLHAIVNKISKSRWSEIFYKFVAIHIIQG